MNFNEYKAKAELVANKLMKEFKNTSTEVILASVTGVLLVLLEQYPPEKRTSLFNEMKDFINFRISLMSEDDKSH